MVQRWCKGGAKVVKRGWLSSGGKWGKDGGMEVEWWLRGDLNGC